MFSDKKLKKICCDLIRDDKCLTSEGMAFTLDEFCHYCSTSPDTLKFWEKEIRSFLSVISMTTSIDLTAYTPVLYKQFYTASEGIRLKIFLLHLQSMNTDRSSFLQNSKIFSNLREHIQHILDDIKKNEE